LTPAALAIVSALWLAVPAGALAATYTSSGGKDSAAQEELRELKSRIDAVQKRLAEAEESKSEAADALRESERSISDAQRALADLTEQSRAARSRLSELRREIDGIESGLEAQRETLGQLLYRQYVAGRPDTAAVLLNGQDPNAVARELHYLSYFARARADLIARLHEDLRRVRSLAAEAETRAAELARYVAEQSEQRKRLEQEKRARARVLVRISRDIEVQRRQIGSLKRDEARLTKLVDQLAKVIARTPRPRPAREVPPRFEPKLQNDRLPESGDDQGPFSRLKGRLALPVRGELANRFGSPRQDSGLMWKGLFIAARGGEDVRAIAGGRVVFADWLRGFGNLLILDHGEGYMSLYGFNETLYKQVGDIIRAGERIAAVGNSGGQPDSGLYFEMRHEGRPFDPLTWVPRR
jgi:septal ring factor EnvC (AmiA/AmiB activator)